MSIPVGLDYLWEREAGQDACPGFAGATQNPDWRLEVHRRYRLQGPRSILAGYLANSIAIRDCDFGFSIADF
jgi:hypothetical protein